MKRRCPIGIGGMADPLWLTSTQQRAGELTGSDAASIVSVQLEYELARSPDGGICQDG
jgi:hypothetical protein